MEILVEMFWNRCTALPRLSAVESETCTLINREAPVCHALVDVLAPPYRVGGFKDVGSRNVKKNPVGPKPP